MHVAHLLRKYDPREWGGTETAVKRLLDGLRSHGVSGTVFAPRLESSSPACDPLAEAGYTIRRYRAFLPIWRISPKQRRQAVAIGGNLMSFDLLWRMLREPGVSVIHSHALNRLAAVARLAARLRRVPFVVTIHGGFMDLPETVRESLARPCRGGIEWGKIFGLLLRSRRVIESADAVVTCNSREALLLRQRYPSQKILVQPHAVSVQRYADDRRSKALSAFPEVRDKTVLLCVGRIDPVKNQIWLVQQLPSILERHSKSALVLVGACTDESYGKALKKEATKLGLESKIVLTGGMHPDDSRLAGLLQIASAVAVPSISETFGLTILEAWAAGAPVISTRTSGASELVREGETGWLFDLDKPEQFHFAIDQTILNPQARSSVTHAARRVVESKYDIAALAGRMKELYHSLAVRKEEPIR